MVQAERPYQIRYTYDSDQIIGEAAIHSRYEHIDDATQAFLRLTAPYKRIAVLEDGQLEDLDELEEVRFRSICDQAGYEVEEIEV